VPDFDDKHLVLVVDSILLLGAAVGIADGEWTAGEAKAPMKMFERAVATSRSNLVRNSLFYFHDRQNTWMSYSLQDPVVKKATESILEASRTGSGNQTLAQKYYKPVAKKAGTMLKQHAKEDRIRVVLLAWMVGLATVESDRPFFGNKRTEVEMNTLTGCAEDLAAAAGCSLSQCLAFGDVEKG
jgi:hypothetical protein